MTTVIATPTYALGTWVANTIDSNGVSWGVEKPTQTGWHDGAPLRLNGAVGGVSTPLNIPRYDGSYRSRSYRDSKTIILTGWAQAPNKHVAEQAWDQFLGLFEGGGQVQLIVTDDYTTRTMLVELSDIPHVSPWETANGFDWSLTLLAIDPRKYGLFPVSASTTKASTSSGLSWPLDWSTGGGLNWGTSTSTGRLSLSNAGTAETWPTFTLTGPLTNPVLTNTLTGQQLAYNQTIASGSSLIISTSPYARTVATGTGADQRANLTTAQWFPVPANGSVSVQLGSSSVGDTGYVSAIAYPAYW